MNIYTLLWFTIGIVFIISELFIPGFTIFFFGCGAILTGIASFFLPQVADGYYIQLLLWLSSSLLSLIFLRKRFSNTFSGKLHKNQTDAFFGKTAKVIDAISPGKSGRISIGGTTWKAETLINQRIPENEKVMIIRRKESESLTFIVDRIIKE
jgi:membrane protein implicated in regulation of membrane protease activity